MSADAANDRLNNIIAVWVAILSCCLAVINIKGGNVAQAIQRTQLEETDSWNQYQAKRLRQFQLEIQVQDVRSRAKDTGTALGVEQAKAVAGWEADIARYKTELKELSEKARGLNAEFKSLNVKDDQLDISQAFLALSLALLAIVALTKVGWLLYVSVGMGAIGAVFGVAAFADWNFIYAGWLVKLLGS